MFDFDRFENTAAWLEYCDGMTRFAAETEAARRQGKKRFEVINEISRRNIERGGDNSKIPARESADDMPGVQSVSKKETGYLPECDVHAGRDSLALLALRKQRGGVL